MSSIKLKKGRRRGSLLLSARWHVADLPGLALHKSRGTGAEVRTTHWHFAFGYDNDWPIGFESISELEEALLSSEDYMDEESARDEKIANALLEEYRPAYHVWKQLYDQQFATRKEALQALEVAMLLRKEEEDIEDPTQ